MDSVLMQKLKTLKADFAKDGFVIEAVFGSYARGEETSQSDVDLLYHLDEKFMHKYGGFQGFKRLDEIKQQLSKELQKSVDLAPKSILKRKSAHSILKDLLYV